MNMHITVRCTEQAVYMVIIIKCHRDMLVVAKCRLCNWFAVKLFKVVVRHMGTVHAHDPSVHVSCAAGGCPQT